MVEPLELLLASPAGLALPQVRDIPAGNVHPLEISLWAFEALHALLTQQRYRPGQLNTLQQVDGPDDPADDGFRIFRIAPEMVRLVAELPAAGAALIDRWRQELRDFECIAHGERAAFARSLAALVTFSHRALTAGQALYLRALFR